MWYSWGSADEETDSGVDKNQVSAMQHVYDHCHKGTTGQPRCALTQTLPAISSLNNITDLKSMSHSQGKYYYYAKR